MSEEKQGGEGKSGDEGKSGGSQQPTTCCPMRRKVVVGIIGVLPEDKSGVADSELADFMRFDLQGADGKPVLAFRFCPWCGAARAPDAEVRIVDVRFAQAEPPPDPEGGFEPPKDFEPPPSGEGPAWDPPKDYDPPSPDGEGWK